MTVIAASWLSQPNSLIFTFVVMLGEVETLEGPFDELRVTNKSSLLRGMRNEKS